MNVNFEDLNFNLQMKIGEYIFNGLSHDLEQRICGEDIVTINQISDEDYDELVNWYSNNIKVSANFLVEKMNNIKR